MSDPLERARDMAAYVAGLGRSYGRGLKNQAVGVYDMVRHPHDTLEGLMNAGIGMQMNPDPYEEALKQYVAQIMSSPDEAAQALGENTGPGELLHGLGAMKAVGGLGGMLNVGLKVGDEVALTPLQIELAMEKMGIHARSRHMGQSATEPTYIVEPSRELPPKEAHKLAVKTRQDAIAQRTEAGGGLYGPKAEEWGQFDPNQFLSPEQGRPYHPFPQFAEEYPPVAPMEMKLFSGQTELKPGRGRTDITDDFVNARRLEQNRIDAGDYNPFFNVGERYDANPALYPKSESTLTHGLPKKQATIDKWRAEIQTDDARARLQAAYDNGVKLGGNEHWYKMGQLEDQFIKEYGPEKGREMFSERFSKAMAATTGGATPTNNLIMAQYGNFMRNKGQRAAERSFDQPVPAIDLKQNMRNYNKVINDEAGLGVGTPKRHNFAANFEGHAGSSTIDDQMHKIITGKPGSPSGDSYFAFEELVNEMAAKNGIDPRQFQEVAWGGHKGVHGKPMIQIVNEAIERTHRLTGMSKEEIVRRGLVRAEIPLYAGAGAALVAPHFMHRDDGA